MLLSMSGAHLLEVLFPVLPTALPLPIVEKLILGIDIPFCPTTFSSRPHNNASIAPQQYFGGIQSSRTPTITSLDVLCKWAGSEEHLELT